MKTYPEIVENMKAEYDKDIRIVDNTMIALQEFNTIPYEYEPNQNFREVLLMGKRSAILCLLRDLQDELIHHRENL